MSTLKELLNDIPVEWKALGDVCKIVGRIGFRGYTKKDIVEEKEGAISLSPSNIKDNEIDYSKCTYISWLKYEESPEIKINNGDIIFCKTASIGKTALIKSLPKEATINPQLVVFKEIKCNNGYLAHIVKSANFKKQISSIVGVGSVPSLSQKDLRKLQIPIPHPNDPQKSLAIQQEIVRVLDSLSEQNKALTSALVQEIDNRKKQYAYYREELFRFEGKEVEWKTLGDVATYSKKRCNISQLNEYNYVGVDNLLQNRSGKTESKHLPFDGNFTAFKFEDILIGNIRPYLKKIWFATCDGGASGDVLVIQNLNDQLSSKYLYQILADDRFFNYNMSFAKGAKMPRGDKKKIMDYKFPIPFPSDKEKSIQEQERIVRLLDQYDEAAKSIVAALEKEIELRNKQYEYYRNLLLTFPKLKKVTEVY